MMELVFSGWQVQPEKQTIQGELEQLITKMISEDSIRIEASGRTDTGVCSYSSSTSRFTSKDRSSLFSQWSERTVTRRYKSQIYKKGL